MFDVTMFPPIKTPKVKTPKPKPCGRGRYLFDEGTRRIFAEYILLRTHWTTPEHLSERAIDIDVQALMAKPFDFFATPPTLDDAIPTVVEAFANLTARHWT